MNLNVYIVLYETKPDSQSPKNHKINCFDEDLRPVVKLLTTRIQSFVYSPRVDGSRYLRPK
jgi:hypothetical protein